MRNIFSKEPMDKDSFIEIIKTSSSDSEKYNSFFKPDNHLINIFESSKLDFFTKYIFIIIYVATSLYAVLMRI